MKEYKDVELRSEEVQEVMGQIPNWIIRWGITLLFIVAMSLIIGSIFFRYPDVIATEMTLTSTDPVANLVARTSGRLSQLRVTDGERIPKNTILGIIENPAAIEDVNLLEGLLTGDMADPDLARNKMLPPRELVLGDIQSTYLSYIRNLYDYVNYQEIRYYPQKIASTQNQIKRYRDYYESQQRQHQVIQAQHALASEQYMRDSVLFVREVLSPAEHETSRSTWLQSQYSLESSLASLESQRIQIAQLEESLLDLQLQQLEKETVLLQEYRTALDQLQNSIYSWRLNYCLTSPIGGIVTFIKYWNENQTVTAGETVFSVIPEKEEQLIGISMLPLARSGKVKVGQRVIIRFTNFPDQEFGIVHGIVKSISLVPNEDNYRVEIDLPQGLKTNYDKILPMSYEMQGTAEIVTEDLRLIERFFQPIKKIFREGFQDVNIEA